MGGVVYLTADQVIELHDIALVEGGLAGVRSQHGLLSAIAQVEQNVFGQEMYPSIPEKAAAYAFFIASGHPFNDGNKRTAVLAMDTFLDLNDYELLQTDDEIEDMIVSLANGTVDQGEFFGWVVNHAKPKSRPSNVITLKN